MVVSGGFTGVMSGRTRISVCWLLRRWRAVIQRYAWFALPVSSTDGSTGLFDAGAVAAEVGRAYEAAGPAR
jgi:hypothetical protein